MVLRSVLLLAFVSAFIFISCSPEHSEIVLAKYGDNQIKMKEFEEVYAKNAGGVEAAKKDSISKLQNFLELYTNFKMKLRDAYVRGYDNDTALTAELNDYKTKVGVTYILEKDVVDPGVKQLYERRKNELRVSHIMIRPDSTGEAAAAKFANAILDSIKSGKATFEDMVAKYSQDVYSKKLGGDIFYVTAGQLPVEFEDAMYNTSEGQVYPQVVKTAFGYHIIKVTQIQPRTPQIRASHILVDYQNAEGQPDSAGAKLKIDSAYAELQKGAKWEDVVAKYSEDGGTKPNGGDLGFFERRMMVKEFDEAAFKLKPGEISPIIQTNFGYHIIKLTDRKPIAPLEEEKENLKKIFQKTRYQAAYDTLVDKYKVQYNYALNQDAYNEIAKNDSLKIGVENPVIDTFKDKVLFTYAGKSFTAGQFFVKLDTYTEYKNRQLTPDMLKMVLNKVTGDVLLAEAALNLDKTNPEFASLMDDYKNGIYIFKLQEEEIWNKINLDSSKLMQFYDSTKENYKWNDRVSFKEIYSKKDSLINSYYSMLQSGTSFDSLLSKSEKPAMKEKGALLDVKTNALTQEAAKLKEGEYSKPIQNAGGWSIVQVVEKKPAGLKTFEEARAEVSSAYQEVETKRLEEEYLESLKKRYQPEIFYDKLTEAYKTE